MPKLTRRQTLQAAASLVAAAALPAALPRPEFSAMEQEFQDALAAFRDARSASFAARPQIMENCKAYGIRAFFRAPEVRARGRARSTALTKAETLIMTQPTNVTERTIRDQIAFIYEDELGGSPGTLDRSLEAERAKPFMTSPRNRRPVYAAPSSPGEASRTYAATSKDGA